MASSESFLLPPGIRMGPVHLRVSNARTCLEFYQEVLGAMAEPIGPNRYQIRAMGGSMPLVILDGVPGAPPPPPRSTGLYHLALRLPGRAQLAGIIRRLGEYGYPLLGAADHRVSEAIYLTDPEGNGVELYRDKPRSQWPFRNGELAMVTRPLNIDLLLMSRGSGDWKRLPASTTLGHVHLKVSSLNKAERFYHHGVGFKITQRTYPGALFFAAGDYHHHLGTNIWESEGGPPLDPACRGLIGFSICLPDAQTLQSVDQQLNRLSFQKILHLQPPWGSGHSYRDLDGITVYLIVAA